MAGFGIARGLSRSIAQLRVRVEDVRAQLAQDVGSVRVEGGGLGGLDAELAQVTARVREVVEQAQRREREALRAEQLAAVGQLAAGVAHEVRNPLVAIKLLIEAALAGGELTADDLRVIHGEVGRLERAVQGLLDFARPAPPAAGGGRPAGGRRRPRSTWSAAGPGFRMSGWRSTAPAGAGRRVAWTWPRCRGSW